MQMVGDRKGVAGLTLGAADLLFDLLEAGFDFPTGAVVLDDLLYRERKVRGKQRHKLCSAKDPNHMHSALQCLQRYHAIIGEHFPLLAIEMNLQRFRSFSIGDRTLLCIAEAFAIFPWRTPTLASRLRRKIVERIIAAQSGEQMKIPRLTPCKPLPQAIITKPTIGDHQHADLVMIGNSLNHLRGLRHLRFKGKHLAGLADVILSCGNVLLHHIETKGQR